MFEYVIEFDQPALGTTYFGNGVHEPDKNHATRFNSYLDAVGHLAAHLPAHTLNEPVEIRIVPAPDNTPWTVEEILAREG
jgi:hypothetical protein